MNFTTLFFNNSTTFSFFNSTTFSFDNLDEEQDMTYHYTSLELFVAVNLIYISGFTIYKYYKNWSNQKQSNKLEMTNQELLDRINELEEKNLDLNNENKSLKIENKNLLDNHDELIDENKDLKEEISILNEDSEDFKDELCNFDADIFCKDEQIKKLLKEKEKSDELYQEMKYEIRKLRKRS